MASTTEYRYVGDYPALLANGRPVASGEFVELTKQEADDPFNKYLIDAGRLITAKTSGGEG